MTDGKIDILVMPLGMDGGVSFYRFLQPYLQLEKQFPSEFRVEISADGSVSQEKVDSLDIIVLHKPIYDDFGAYSRTIESLRNRGVVVVTDLDDHWQVSPHHPHYTSEKEARANGEALRKALPCFDYVTTTTEAFAERIRRTQPNVKVFPNAIDPSDPRFQNVRKPSSLLRVGFVMGSTHEWDVKLVGNISNQLKGLGVMDRVQLVLCGFDTRGSYFFEDANGKMQERPMTPQETVWYRYEKQITDNYSIVTPQYSQFLRRYIWQSQYLPWEENEHYRRLWTKDMDHYYSHFGNVDVLLAPLEPTEYNAVKSPLKVVECCFSKTAIIASDFGPYREDITSAIGKGGEIVPSGNGLLVDEMKNHKLWGKYIARLVREPELLHQLQENIYSSLHDKYDLRNVTSARAEWCREIVAKGRADILGA